MMSRWAHSPFWIMRDRLFIHVTWTTRDRGRLIDVPRADFLASFLPIVCRQERANLLCIGIVQTHLHLLIKIHPTTQLPRLLQRLKGASATLANRRVAATITRSLRWARGYDVESVSPKAVRAVGDYVRSAITCVRNTCAIPMRLSKGGRPLAVAFSDISRDATLSRGQQAADRQKPAKGSSYTSGLHRSLPLPVSSQLDSQVGLSIHAGFNTKHSLS
jgi:REP element-mobilizing transposase RayT